MANESRLPRLSFDAISVSHADLSPMQDVTRIIGLALGSDKIILHMNDHV